MLIATERHRFPVLDPSDGSVIDSLEAAGPDDGIAAVDAAARAAEDWAARAPRERGEILRRGYELLTEKCEDDRSADRARDGQAARRGARRGRLRGRVPALVLRGGRARRAATTRSRPRGTNRMLVGHAPIGVSLLITPWNFPAAMAARKLGPALAAGCTVVLKPAEETPLTALLIVGAAARGGRPGGRRQPRRHRRARRRWSRPSSPTRACASCPSPARPRSGAGCSSCARRRSSARRWSSAATRPSWSWRTPTSTSRSRARWRPRCATAARPARPPTASSCTSRSPRPSRRPSPPRWRRCASAPGFEEGAQLGPLINAAAREKVERLVADAVDRGARVRTGGERAARARVTSIRRRCSTASQPRQRDAGRGGLRPGRADHDLRRPRPRRSSSPTTPSTGSSRSSSAATCGGRCASARRSRPAWWGSTAGSCPIRRRRSAAPSSPGSAARAATTGCYEFLEPKYFAFD